MKKGRMNPPSLKELLRTQERGMKKDKPKHSVSEAGANESRPPTVHDLVGLCRKLNEADAKYIVIGGMAVVQHGFVRATEDIDLIVDASAANQDRIRSALMGLPDGAVRDMKPDDLDAYMVVRVADEIVVDLMKSANGIEYAEASASIEWAEIQGVRIPFADLKLLWRLKQTVREKDALDRLFLKEKLKTGAQDS